MICSLARSCSATLMMEWTPKRLFSVYHALVGLSNYLSFVTTWECKIRSCPIKQLRCTARFVVYEPTCKLCKKTYIGSTTRALHDRAKEHITAAKTHNRSLAIGEHYFTFHRTKEPQLQFRIIRFTEKDELRLRIHEATIIQRLAPAMNRRKEETGVGFLA